MTYISTALGISPSGKATGTVLFANSISFYG
jgi:hypothetical protein